MKRGTNDALSQRLTQGIQIMDDQSDRPLPGQYCDKCCSVVPLPQALSAQANHPETSHNAAKKANKRLNARRASAFAIVDARGDDGYTDDEVDERTIWGHQITSSVMSNLREMGVIGWKYDQNGERVTRLTRKGHPAGVNVAARFCKYPAKPGTTKRRKRK